MLLLCQGPGATALPGTRPAPCWAANPAAWRGAALLNPCGKGGERERTISHESVFCLPLPCPVMFTLMLVLLWVGAVCLCYRQLHQTSTLSVAVMEESYRDTLECTEEDITDKVRVSALLERVVFAMP